MIQVLNYERTFFNNFALHSYILPKATVYYDRNIYLSPMANYHFLFISHCQFSFISQNQPGASTVLHCM